MDGDMEFPSDRQIVIFETVLLLLVSLVLLGLCTLGL
jgi:hypothetical protein